MKFYYINNSLCEDCDGCSLACGSGAVYASGGKRYIMHEKCTSCGVCIRTCGHNAVSIESIDAMVERMENSDLYLDRIRRLEQELSAVNDKFDRTEKALSLVIESSAGAMALCDDKGKIRSSNAAFARMAGGMAGRCENLSGFLSVQTAGMILRGYGRGQVEFTDSHTGKRYSVHSKVMPDGTLLCVFDDLSDGHILSARISQALENAVTRQMEMVRQIGTVLGDGTSLSLNDINTALGLLGSGGWDER